MTSDVELGEAGGLAYRSAGAGAGRPRRRWGGVTYQPGPNRREDRGELDVIGGAGHFPFAETPERYWPVAGRWLDETAPRP